MASNFRPPIIIHKGKKTKRQIKRLKKGRGKLADKVENYADRCQQQLGNDKIVVPIVVSYKRKGDFTSKKSGGINGLLGM